MSIPARNTYEPVETTTLYYDISVSTRINQDTGQLEFAAGLILHPANNTGGIWVDASAKSVPYLIPDLATFATANPEFAEKLWSSMDALNSLVQDINDKLKLM